MNSQPLSFVTNLHVPKHRRLVDVFVRLSNARIMEIGDGLVRVTVPSLSERSGSGTEDPPDGLVAGLASADYIPLSWEHPSPSRWSLQTLTAALTEKIVGLKPTDVLKTQGRNGTVYSPHVGGKPVRVDRAVYAEIVNAVDLSVAEGSIAYAHPLATLALKEVFPGKKRRYVLDDILLVDVDVELDDTIRRLEIEGWWLGHRHLSTHDPTCLNCRGDRELLSHWPSETKKAWEFTYYRFSAGLETVQIRLGPPQGLWFEHTLLRIHDGRLPVVRLTEFVDSDATDMSRKRLQLASLVAYGRLLPFYSELLQVLADDEGGSALVLPDLTILAQLATFEQAARFVVFVREELARVDEVSEETYNTLESALAGKGKWDLVHRGRNSYIRLRDLGESLRFSIAGTDVRQEERAGTELLASLGLLFGGTGGTVIVPELRIAEYPESIVLLSDGVYLLEMSREGLRPGDIDELKDAWVRGDLQDPWTLLMYREGESAPMRPGIRRSLFEDPSAPKRSLSKDETDFLLGRLRD